MSSSRLAVAGLFCCIVSLLCAPMGCASVPHGEAGPAADALAREVERWVDRDAWERTGAVRFTFLGGRTHVWDRTRGLLEVKDGDLSILLDLWDHGGTATKKGAPLQGDALREALDDAWTWFCNDTFWLNPLTKLFDDGVRRELVSLDDAPGGRALLVSYGSGGVTPGDSYLWLVDETGRPTAVRMWVSVLPWKGIEFSWDGWTTLATGAKVASEHAGPGGYTVTIRDIRGAASLDELLGTPAADPFGPLVARRAGR